MNTSLFYFSHKSNTCFSKNGTALSVYDTYDEAQKSADYQSSNTNFTPYQCSTCGKYHLKPTEFYCQKIISRCSCRDHKGNTKDTYATFQDAEKMVNIRKQAGVILYVYKCPEGKGFHLTSNKGF